jgi:hypothetical protein
MLAWSAYNHQTCLLWKSIKHYTFIPAIEMHTWRKHPSSCALQPLCPSQQSQALLSVTHQHIKKLKKTPFWLDQVHTKHTWDPEFMEQRHNTKSAIQITVLPKSLSSCHLTFVWIKHMQLTVGQITFRHGYFKSVIHKCYHCDKLLSFINLSCIYKWLTFPHLKSRANYAKVQQCRRQNDLFT